eukprot:scaffold1518_cov331-Pavlova_lutheri.AAC.44
MMHVGQGLPRDCLTCGGVEPSCTGSGLGMCPSGNNWCMVRSSDCNFKYWLVVITSVDTVCTRPPTRDRASSTTTLSPARCREDAAANPAGPAPTMTQWYPPGGGGGRIRRCLGCKFFRGRRRVVRLPRGTYVILPPSFSPRTAHLPFFRATRALMAG